MLSADARLRKSTEISLVLRGGRRFASQLLVLHVAPGRSTHTRFAFAVGKNVGNSVVRHRLTRQLRHLAKDSASHFPVPTDVVVRALPGTSSASFTELRESFVTATKKACA
jgi:ribonuclease P protein component